MKKVILFLLISVMIFLVTSCKKKPSEGSSKTESTISYYDGGSVENTSTRVLYSLVDQLCYYNKITGETAVFCFDPMCRHGDWRSCISLKFIANGLSSVHKIQYNEYDNRFYTLRGDKLCSFSFDGSDLKIVYSFGEKGALDQNCAGGSVHYMQLSKNRVYVSVPNAENGRRDIVYYDIDTGKLFNLTQNSGKQTGYYWLFENELYFWVYEGEESYLYRSDLDMKYLRKTEMDGVFGHSSLFHQNRAYYLTKEQEDELMIKSYDLQNGEIKTVCPIGNENNLQPCILAISDTFLYFIKRESIDIGYELIRGTIEQHMYNDFSKIYRVDLESGEVTAIFDDPNCEVAEIYFLENAKVLIKGWFCKYGEGDAEKTEALFIADVDENGIFRNSEKLEDPR